MASAFDTKQQNAHIESKIIVALERISEAFRVLLWQEGKANSLSPIQIQILIFLLFHSEKKCRVSYLAAEFNMTKPTISDSVKLLLEKGLIKKRTDNSDTRSFSILLTQEGNQMAQKLASFTAAFEKPLIKLNNHQKEILLISLLQLIEKLNLEGILTIQRMCLTCRFYNKENSEHFCGLIKKRLTNAELRVDCSEHELIKVA